MQEIDRQKPATTIARLAPQLPHVVIVGGGFGGLAAARPLAHAAVQVTIIDRHNYHLFQPLLYWVATAGLSPADISSPIRHIVRRQKNTEVVLAEVTGIDLAHSRVLIGAQAISYDYLVLATGAQDNYFRHPEWRAYAPGLKSLQEAIAIRSHILRTFERAEMETDPATIQELLTFVLVGAGPTGVEMAGAIAELARKALARDFRHINPAATRVILVEAAPRILAGFPEKLARKAQKALHRLGVEVRTGTPVADIAAEGIRLAEQRIACKTVIWSAGVAASPAGQWLGAEVDRAGRVRVNPDLTVPGYAHVFAIGDTATLLHADRPLPGVAPVAMQQGRYVAALIKQRVTTGGSERPFRYLDKGNLATVGRSYAIVDLKGCSFTGLPAWILWLLVHIYYLIGFRNRLITLFQWAWTYITFKRGARLITTETERT